jgi:hypothetical protein
MALLTEEQVQTAFDWLNDNLDAVGAALYLKLDAEYKVEQTEARLMLQSLESSDTKRKAWARAHQDYINACQDHAEAAGHYAKMNDRKAHYERVMDLFRTQSANEREFVRRTR